MGAPSGAGKTSLVNALLQQSKGIQACVSHTTRGKREGEIEGVNYHFVDKETFLEMVKQSHFLEHAEVFGNYYGTSQKWVEDTLKHGTDVILEIDWQGAEQARKKLSDQVSIMILPPSLAELENRLRSRGKDSEDVILRRLSSARAEMSQAKNFDYLIVNEDFKSAADELASIITAERTRTARTLQRRDDVVPSLIGD